MSHPLIIPLLALCLVLPACAAAPAFDPALRLPAYDDEPYARVLGAAVRGGMVDYPAIDQALSTELDIYLDAAARFGPRTTPEAFPSEHDRLAYHLNTYNAVMIRLWLDHGARTAAPDDRVDWMTWFTIPRWTIDGRSMTLDDLEQRLIRPEYDDPRIHAALVCGAASCPPLRDEPYAGDRLDEQLDDQMRRWLADPAGDALRVDEQGTVWLSAIFGWYRDDFRATGGLEAVLATYLDDDDPRKPPARDAARDNRLKFAPYDWTINLP